jgi:hypothetical protein
MNWTKDDKKAFMIGIAASLAVIIAWDVAKYGLKILDYSEKTKS